MTSVPEQANRNPNYTGTEYWQYKANTKTSVQTPWSTWAQEHRSVFQLLTNTELTEASSENTRISSRIYYVTLLFTATHARLEQLIQQLLLLLEKKKLTTDAVQSSWHKTWLQRGDARGQLLFLNMLGSWVARSSFTRRKASDFHWY